MSSSIPKTGDLIINPKTQRPVKVGSRTWLKLVKEGIVEGSYSDPNEIYSLQEGDDEDDLISQFNEQLPDTVHAVRGRGKYANKIVKRSKQSSTKDTVRHTARATARKLKDPEVYEELQEGGDFEDDLMDLIMAELASGSCADAVAGGSQKQRQHSHEYQMSKSILDQYVDESDDYEDAGQHTQGQSQHVSWESDDY
jgi:hypothetical protein